MPSIQMRKLNMIRVRYQEDVEKLMSNSYSNVADEFFDGLFNYSNSISVSQLILHSKDFFSLLNYLIFENTTIDFDKIILFFSTIITPQSTIHNMCGFENIMETCLDKIENDKYFPRCLLALAILCQSNSIDQIKSKNIMRKHQFFRESLRKVILDQDNQNSGNLLFVLIVLFHFWGYSEEIFNVISFHRMIQYVFNVVVENKSLAIMAKRLLAFLCESKEFTQLLLMYSSLKQCIHELSKQSSHGMDLDSRETFELMSSFIKTDNKEFIDIIEQVFFDNDSRVPLRKKSLNSLKNTLLHDAINYANLNSLNSIITFLINFTSINERKFHCIISYLELIFKRLLQLHPSVQEEEIFDENLYLFSLYKLSHMTYPLLGIFSEKKCKPGEIEIKNSLHETLVKMINYEINFNSLLTRQGTNGMNGEFYSTPNLNHLSLITIMKMVGCLFLLATTNTPEIIPNRSTLKENLRSTRPSTAETVIITRPSEVLSKIPEKVDNKTCLGQIESTESLLDTASIVLINSRTISDKSLIEFSLQILLLLKKNQSVLLEKDKPVGVDFDQHLIEAFISHDSYLSFFAAIFNKEDDTQDFSSISKKYLAEIYCDEKITELKKMVQNYSEKDIQSDSMNFNKILMNFMRAEIFRLNALLNQKNEEIESTKKYLSVQIESERKRLRQDVEHQRNYLGVVNKLNSDFNEKFIENEELKGSLAKYQKLNDSYARKIVDLEVSKANDKTLMDQFRSRQKELEKENSSLKNKIKEQADKISKFEKMAQMFNDITSKK